MSSDDRAPIKSFKHRCKSEPPLIGCFLNLASPLVAELVVSSGFDCVLIDREHSPADLMTALGMLHAVRAAGGAVLMRVPANDPAEIKRAVETLLGSKVEHVRTAIAHGKVKRQGRFAGQRSDWKKAYVKLREGEKLPEFFEGA